MDTGYQTLNSLTHWRSSPDKGATRLKQAVQRKRRKIQRRGSRGGGSASSYVELSPGRETKRREIRREGKAEVDRDEAGQPVAAHAKHHTPQPESPDDGVSVRPEARRGQRWRGEPARRAPARGPTNPNSQMTRPPRNPEPATSEAGQAHTQRAQAYQPSSQSYAMTRA